MLVLADTVVIQYIKSKHALQKCRLQKPSEFQTYLYFCSLFYPHRPLAHPAALNRYSLIPSVQSGPAEPVYTENVPPPLFPLPPLLCQPLESSYQSLAGTPPSAVNNRR